jgi:hypothetical protein
LAASDREDCSGGAEDDGQPASGCQRRIRPGAHRALTSPREQHELLRQLRKEQATDEWHDRYSTRAGIEGTISQAVRAFGLRRCRYKGIAKTRVQHTLTATAINLTRLDAWTCGTPLGRTRVSHLAALNSRKALSP